MTLLALAALLLLPQSDAGSKAPASPQQRTFGNRGIAGYLGTVVEVDLPFNGSTERMALMIPDTPMPSSAAGAPLVVYFHSAIANYLEFTLHVDLLTEIARRGWYLISPFQTPVPASVPAWMWANYGNADAMDRTRVALDFALERLPVDPARVYGLGWSMGGGVMQSFAAQNTDPTRGAFAAMVHHTGTLSLENEWWNNASSRMPMFNAFLVHGPSAPPYIEAQVLDYDMLGWDPLGFNPAWNIQHVPLMSWFDTRQQNIPAYAHHEDEIDTLDAMLDTHVVRKEVGPTQIAHDFKLLVPADVCDFLGTYSLTVPSRGSLAVTRSGRSHDLHVVRKDANFLTELDYDLDVTPAAVRTLRFGWCSNLLQVMVDRDAGMLPGTLRIEVARDRHPFNSNRETVRVRLEDFGAAPSSVLQNGAVAVRGPQAQWDMVGSDLVLQPDTSVSRPDDVWDIVR